MAFHFMPTLSNEHVNRRMRTWVAAVIAAGAVAGCSTYEDRVAPVPLPESQAGHVEVGGVKLAGEAYVEPASAKKAFGFDARGAGLLPVRFVLDNQSGKPVKVQTGQTFLLDREGQAWPLLSSDQAYDRVKGKVEIGETFAGAAKPAALLGVAGAVVGAAVGIVTGENVGSSAVKGGVIGGTVGAVGGGGKAHESIGQKIHEDLARESLINREIAPGELAYGYLFFPGKKEAQSASALRLSLSIGDEQRIVTLGL
jgi:hypothetical protein